jgi:hypothetical protein
MEEYEKIFSRYILTKVPKEWVKSIAEDLKREDCKLVGDIIANKGSLHVVTIHISGSSGLPKIPNSPYIS